MNQYSKPYHRVLGNEMVYVRDVVLDLSLHFRSHQGAVRNDLSLDDSVLPSAVPGCLQSAPARRWPNQKNTPKNRPKISKRFPRRKPQRQEPAPLFFARIRDGRLV